jgi:hypothetical protein
MPASFSPIIAVIYPKIAIIIQNAAFSAHFIAADAINRAFSSISLES